MSPEDSDTIADMLELTEQDANAQLRTQLGLMGGACLSMVNAVLENAKDPAMRNAAIRLLDVMDACPHYQTNERFMALRQGIGEARQ